MMTLLRRTNRRERSVGNNLRRVVAATLVAAALIGPASSAEPLSDDDVSWLFPAPHTVSDLGNLIAIKDVGSPTAIWTPQAFQSFVSIAEGTASLIPELNAQIGLPADAHKIDAWFVAGIRIDAGAPGLSPQIVSEFGQRPQIRLIIQPVTISGNQVIIHDYAGHLIFDFVKDPTELPAPGCFPRAVPDSDAFQSVVDDVRALKVKLAAGGFDGVKISTSGLPLGIHPGLDNPATAADVAREMKLFLIKHLHLAKLSSMAVVGTPAIAPSPWIFVSMLAVPGVGIIPVPSPTLDGTQTAIALKSARAVPRVVPTPTTNNEAAITCRSAARGPNALPVAVRQGVSTASIFAIPSMPTDEQNKITATIADPASSHFFNTDCASCHTETRLAIRNGVAVDVDPNVQPQNDWVVRNFGWAASGDGGHATATRRTETETRAITQYLNSH